jgi:hypothetical protein
MLALACALGLALADAPGSEPTPTADDVDVEAESKPRRFRLQTASMEIGVGWRPEFYGTPNSPPPCGLNVLCGVTPRVGFDAEFGTRAARLVVGGYTAPIPYFVGVVALEALMFDAGGLFGGPKVRAGLLLDFGAINVGGSAVLRVSPWVDRRGHRHGFDLRVSGSLWIPFGVALAYRWYPRKLDRQR